MKFKGVRQVYDTVLKIVILIWPDVFLKFIGIDEKVDEVLKTELVTDYGKKVPIDYLCRLKNGNLLHIEFEYPSAYNDDLERYTFYY